MRIKDCLGREKELSYFIQGDILKEKSIKIAFFIRIYISSDNLFIFFGIFNRTINFDYVM